MASSHHANMCKKFEEFENHIYSKLQEPTDSQSHSRIENFQTKIDFFKSFFAMEIESDSPGNHEYLEGLVDRLSALEKNFDEWVTSGSIEGPVSPCSCTSSCFNEEEQEEGREIETNEEKKQEEQEVEGEKKENLTEEKDREELKVDLLKKHLENIIAEYIARADKKENRRGIWIGRIGMVAAAAAAVLAAIGLALLGIGSVEESVYFVPT